MAKIVQISAVTVGTHTVPTLFALDDEGRMWKARVSVKGTPLREGWLEVPGPEAEFLSESDDSAT